MKRPPFSSTARHVRVLSTCVATLACATAVSAQVICPSNADVTVTPNGPLHWIIQQNIAGNAVLDCSSFSFDNQVWTEVRHGVNDRLLIRIAGGPSFIDGSISANGFVYLANPSGLSFGSALRIMVGGFYAVAGTVDENMFRNNPTMDRFDTSAGGVVTLEDTGFHSINAVKSFHLIGRQVVNRGHITVGSGGVVTMLAAEDHVVFEELGARISVIVDGVTLDPNLQRPGSGVPTLTGNIGVDNAGIVDAPNGQVVLGAGDMYSLAIRHTGDIRNAGANATSQMTALGGTVWHDGMLNTGDLSMTGDAIVLNKDIKADDARFNDNVILASNIKISGSAGADADTITFESTVDSETGEQNRLEIDGKMVARGDIGKGQALDTLDVSGTSELAGDVSTANGILFGDQVTLSGAVGSEIGAGTGRLDFLAGVNQTGTGTVNLAGNAGIFLAHDATTNGNLVFANDVTLNRTDGMPQTIAASGIGSTVTAMGNVNKTTAGNAVIEGNGGTFLHGDVTTNDGSLTLRGDIELRGGMMQALTAGGAGARLNLEGTGFNPGSVRKTTDGALALTGAGGITLNGDASTSSGAMMFNDALTLTGTDNQSIAAGGTGRLTFSEAVQKMNAGNLTLAAGADILINDTLNVLAGDLFAMDAVTLNGGAVTTSGNQVYAGDVTLGADTTMTATRVQFDEDVQGAGNDLSIVGNAILGDAVDDAIAGLGDFAITGTTAFNINELTTNGTQTYGGDVTFDPSTTLTGTEVAFGGDVTGTGGNLTINADTTTFSGTTSGFFDLETDAAGTTFIGGDVTVGGGIKFLDAVRLNANVALVDNGTGGIEFGSTLDGPFTLLIQTNGNLRFGGNVGGTSPLQRLETVVQGVLAFGGPLVQVAGDVVLNEQVVISVPATATIGADGSITIVSLNGDFRMGRNQKFSVLGSFTVFATGGTAFLSDINTIGDLTISAPDIVLLTRDPGTVTRPDGSTVTDAGLDFVAGGRFHFATAPRVDGTGGFRFSSQRADADANDTLPQSALRPYGEIATAATIRPANGPNTGVFLDLAAIDPGPSDLAEAIAAAADDADENSAKGDAVLPPLARTVLTQYLGITTRTLAQAELLGLTEGHGIYIDQPTTNVVPQTSTAIAINRIARRNAVEAVTLWMELTGYDPATDTVTREPSAIAADLERAMRAGLDDSRDLQLLSGIVTRLNGIGMTAAELATPVNKLVSSCKPASLDMNQMWSLLGGAAGS